MKYSTKEVFNFLKLFGDMQPHKFTDQYVMYRTLYKGDMIPICRWAMHNGFVVGVGKNFTKMPLGLRNFRLTDKGDNLFRQINIQQGADQMYYKYFDRTPSDRWADHTTIKGANLN
jgi:hypothetical protein